MIYNKFHKNILENDFLHNFKGLIITSDFAEQTWLDIDHFALDSSYLQYISKLSENEQLLSIKSDFFKDSFFAEVIKNPENNLHIEAAINFYIKEPLLLKRFIEEQNNYSFLNYFLISGGNDPMFMQKIKQLNCYNENIKDFILEKINDLNFEQQLEKITNNLEVFNEQEQLRILREIPRENQDIYSILRNKAKIFNLNFLKTIKSDENDDSKSKCFLRIKLGEPIDDNIIKTIFTRRKAKFGINK